ncbi:hypothetical protein [Caldanaerobacter subterraneus]|uniref:Uncharacterized protein n=1 Tax=Caldanaerobacter subterraneus TaxID=911092 RepID=A0A7Y2L9D7_9THEO|nr:hypothetical protein [Caldanaerobacter subterraneus]
MLDEREDYEEYLKRAAVIKAAEEWDEPIFQKAESYEGSSFGIVGFLVIFYLLDKAVSFLIKAEMVVRPYFKEIMSFLNWIFGYIHFFKIS